MLYCDRVHPDKMYRLFSRGLVFLLFIHSVECKTNVHGNINSRHHTYSERFNKVRDLTRTRTGQVAQIPSGLAKVRTNGAFSTLKASKDDGSCAEHMAIVDQAVKQGTPWATKLFDTIGKQPVGMEENPVLNWVGEFDECMNIEPVAYEDNANKTGQYTPFETKYCTAYFNGTVLNPFATEPFYINVGFCFPDSCNTTDIMGLAKLFTTTTPLLSTLPVVYATCRERKLELDGKAKAVISVCAIFLALIALGTCIDIFILLSDGSAAKDGNEKRSTANGHANSNRLVSNPSYEGDADEKSPLLDDMVKSNSHTNATSHHSYDVSKVPDETETKTRTQKFKPNLLCRLALSFSVYTNAKKLLNTSQPAGTLTSVNGIRFITMTWVILGHTFVFGERSARNWGSYFTQLIKRFTYQAIANETVAVDTFFVLSGLLVAYLTLKEIEKKKGPGKVNWFMFYFHRFWRLTPPYMFVLMLYVPLIKYWGDGPLWSQTGVEDNECKKTWWRNLLYINNLYDTDKMCMGWSWYLANDMQFYVISPLILVPFYYSGLAGSMICLLLVLANLITTGAISKHYNISAQIKLNSPPDTDNSFDKIYVKPYTRIAPYAIGLAAGYLLYKTNCKININKGKTVYNISQRRWYQFINILGWATATALALLVMYAPYTSDGKYNMSENESAFYNACFRTAWGLAIAWVVLACATGYGGPVNKLLSWPAIIPLSRLTYCAYLVHPVVMDVYYMSQRQLIYWFDLQIIYEFLGHLCMSYGAAFVVSLAFESPMMGLEKVLLGRDKRS